jgi:hypothetical protein
LEIFCTIPDTDCTKPIPRSALLPKGYAMISRRAVHRAMVLLDFRAAERSAPMMGIERASFSRRTILFLIILFGTPFAAQTATLEDSARELARKIAASLPLQEGVSIEMRNDSSLSPNEFASVEQTLRDELENLKVPISTTGTAAVNLKITISENMKGLLLTVEIFHGGASQVILMEASRGLGFHIASYMMPIVLHSKIIWEGPERILDAATVTGPGGFPRLILLLRDALEIRDSAGNIMDTVTFPSVSTLVRDPRGKLETAGNITQVVIQSEACNVDTDTLELLGCHAATGRETEVGEEVPNDLRSPERGLEILMPQNGCGAALATGPGDYTQTDWVQAFSVKPPGLAISNKLDFPGPILALRGGSGGSRAIVRNLKTGNYEAYSLSCGK